jgi:hypothetical protein
MLPSDDAPSRFEQRSVNSPSWQVFLYAGDSTIRQFKQPRRGLVAKWCIRSSDATNLQPNSVARAVFRPHRSS